jgi:hypothetical protein
MPDAGRGVIPRPPLWCGNSTITQHHTNSCGVGCANGYTHAFQARYSDDIKLWFCKILVIEFTETLERVVMVDVLEHKFASSISGYTGDVDFDFGSKVIWGSPLGNWRVPNSSLALLRGTTLQDRNWPSWASNDDPLKDLSNTRTLKHLASLATDYWAASHTFVEPGHSCFRSKFEKIVSVSEFLAGRMQWGRAAAGMETVGPPSKSKCDSVKG